MRAVSRHASFATCTSLRSRISTVLRPHLSIRTRPLLPSLRSVRAWSFSKGQSTHCRECPALGLPSFFSVSFTLTRQTLEIEKYISIYFSCWKSTVLIHSLACLFDDPEVGLEPTEHYAYAHFRVLCTTTCKGLVIITRCVACRYCSFSPCTGKARIRHALGRPGVMAMR